MPVSIDQVLNQLDRDQPDYALASRLGPAAIPHLRALVGGDNIGLAVKAVYLATLIEGAGAADIVSVAANHPNPLFRVVAADALRRLSAEGVEEIAPRLVSDPDIGVRRKAISGLPRAANPRLLDRLRRLAGSLPEGEQQADVIEAIQKVRSY